jgi:hypothetical protein
MAPAVVQSAYPSSHFFHRLRESHEFPVYQAMERLTHAGEAVGYDADVLVWMLDRGMIFEELLELIESKIAGSNKAA